MKRLAIGAAVIAALTSWLLWPADPEAWRTAIPAELVEKPRWNAFLGALKQGDDEALARVVPILPLIKTADHREEELHGALEASLAARPARTLEVIQAGKLQLETICYSGTRETRESLAALIDAGFGEAAQSCLTAMSTPGSAR